jgi:hypothetical protein
MREHAGTRKEHKEKPWRALRLCVKTLPTLAVNLKLGYDQR